MVSLLSWSRENFISLIDTGLEKDPVLHHSLDVLKWQVDQHTSDLWSLFWGKDLLDEFEEDGTGLVLVVRVLGNHGWEDLVALGDELLVDAHLLLHLHLLLLLHLHLLLLLHLHLLHLLHVSVHHVHVHVVATHVTLHSLVVSSILWLSSLLLLHVALVVSLTLSLVHSTGCVSLHHWSLWSEEGWERL